MKGEDGAVLADKVVAITGASSGIGAEMARLFAERGATVLMMARSEVKLKQLQQKIGGKTDWFVLDVTSSSMVDEAFTAALERYGRIDILVNNAGFGLFRPFLSLSEQEIEEMMDVNYFGMVRCTRAVLPQMIERGSGHIINISSIAGKVGTAKTTAYAATKHAVLGFTSALRQELAGTGVHVSAFNPGPIRTPFFDRADPSGQYLRNLPGWFVLHPEKTARAVVRLAETKKREMDIPFSLAIASKLYALFPGWSERVAGKWINRK